MDVQVTVRQYGKVFTFLGVLLLTVGLLQGPVSAGGWGHEHGAQGHDNASGWQRTHGSDDEQATVAASSDNGANADCGAYCSTSDGTPSGNGNGGNGNQPCAGCVGNADNENPSGQHHDGSDHNNGYECDGNSGIARGNPAHSGCQATTTTVPEVTTTTVPQTTTTVPQTTTTVPQTTTTVPQTTTTVAVGGTTTTTGPEVLGVQFSRGSSDPLASTGAGFMRPFTLLGALLLLLGVALMTIKVRPQAAV